jgi:pimeloyl-ACP methyl ester carboxylesterase
MQIVRNVQLRGTEGVQVRHDKIDIDGVQVFYREAGNVWAATILLLHGFPTSSHMFRNLIPVLATRYHVIAPDYVGFGFSDAPDHRQFEYTFDHLAEIIDALTIRLHLNRYVLYLFDYGAPIGLRLALRHPNKVLAIVSQNGNAYVEGLGHKFWQPVQKYWHQPTTANRNTLRKILTPEVTKFFYLQGVRPNDKTLVAPESYTLDAALLARPGNDEIQLDLLLDYASNVNLYPRFQRYFRDSQPPLLAVWGKNDTAFIPEGALAFQRDLPDAEVRFYDTGHFALETHSGPIANAMIDFLERNLI